MRQMAAMLLDNPILVKHLRSRLRPGQVVPWAAIVLVLSACISWAGADGRLISDGQAVIALLGLQILLIALAGANQINASLGGARESGILAFHRVSPLHPGIIAAGFFLGAPVREYALAAITLPLAGYSAWHADATSGWNGLRWLEQLEAGVLLIGWLVHALAMFGCLNRKKPRGSIQGTVVTLFLLVFLGSYASIGFYFGAQWLLDHAPRLNFFGHMIPWLAWLALYVVPALGFLALAVTRKLRAERAHSCTKPQALACMATLTCLLPGGTWHVARLFPKSYPSPLTVADAVIFAVLYALVLSALMLSATVTPGVGEYVKGVRRALREGRRRPGAWSDAGSNRVVLFALAAFVLLGATTAVHVVGRPPILQPGDLNYSTYWPQAPAEKALLDDHAWLASRQQLFSRPIAIGVLTLTCFGFANQYFVLRFRRSGTALLAVFLFLAWLVPLLVGAIIGMGANTPEGEQLSLVVLSLSPLAGIVLSSGIDSLSSAEAIQLAALALPLTFTFVFKYLLVVVQRQIDRKLRNAEKPAAQAPSPVPIIDGRTPRIPSRLSRE